MQRDWQGMDSIYQSLLRSVYPQPEDGGHTELAFKALKWAGENPTVDMSKVLDLGAGEGFCMDILVMHHRTTMYLGISLGEDVYNGREKGRQLWEADFNFLPDDVLHTEFTFGISRHSLEHSPFPILTLCHWRTLHIKHLLVVLPHPEWYKFRGKNHFSVMTEGQAENAFEQSGWRVVKKYIEMKWGSPDRADWHGKTPQEMWYLLE